MSEQFLRGESVFEITDHTTASDWERFISGLEDILTEFKLHKQSDTDKLTRELPDGFISSGLWHEKHDELRFGKVTFDVRYQYLDDSNLKATSKGKIVDHYASQPDARAAEQSEEDSLEWCDAENEEGSDPNEVLIEEKKDYQEHQLPEELPECLLDLVATSNDFASKAHCLVRWYNFRKFILLVPRGDTIISEDRIKSVLSSASIALANIDCHVPVLLQTHNPKNHFYQGVSEHSNIRTMYEMVLYRQNVQQYSYLSELIGLFREKISCNLNDPISASIRLNYCLDFFELFLRPHEEFAGNEFESERDELVEMTASRKKMGNLRIQDMRSGASLDQVKEAMDKVLPHPYKILKFIHVAALWPPVSDKVITDSRVHSDLDPVEAPIWTIRCVTNDNCNMKLVHETQVINDLLQAAIKYAYDRLDASQVFTDCDRSQLEADCLKLSYELATNPEVVVSRNPSDSIRKLIALLFYRSSELKAEMDALDQIAAQLKKRPSLSEVYRDFKRQKASVKEFIIRTQISRPFCPITTPALPQRMFCTICDEEFRLCGAFSELCN